MGSLEAGKKLYTNMLFSSKKQKKILIAVYLKTSIN